MTIVEGAQPNEEGGRITAHLDHAQYRNVPNRLDGLDWDDVPRLASSDDPMDRALLYGLLRGPLHWVHLPPGTWCVVRSYSDNFMRPGPCSAHFTREEAERWLPAWVEYNTRLRNGRYVFHVEQRDDAMASDLREPEADPFACLAHLGRG